MSVRKLASAVGHSEGWVRSRLALLSVPDQALDALHAGTITIDVATALTAVAEHPDLVDQLVTQRGLTVWQIESAHRSLLALTAAGVLAVSEEDWNVNRSTWKTLDELRVDATAHRIEPCHWTGSGSPLLGLADEVAGDDFRAALAGLAPNTGLTPNGTRLTSHPLRVPGFDLTFAVPKSVSIVYALGDPLVQAAVIDGCEAALAESMSWLQREACFVRRGTNNRRMAADPAGFGTRRMIAEGFVAAQFPTAPHASVTHICTGTCWSPTWPEVSTVAGPPSTAPPCSGCSVRSASCSRL